VIQWFVLVAMLGGPRFLTRLLVPRRGRWARSPAAAGRGGVALGRVPVAIVGADEQAALFLRSLEQDPDSPYQAVAVLDLASAERGRQLRGTPVLAARGGLLRAALEELGRHRPRPTRLVITKLLDREVMRVLLEAAERLRMTICRLPSLTEFKAAGEDDGRRLELRPVALEELLGRPEALPHVDQAAIDDLIRGRRVLVTGAGGSIGSELVRQVVRRGPGRLVLADSGELNLYTIDREVGRGAPGLSRRPSSATSASGRGDAAVRRGAAGPRLPRRRPQARAAGRAEPGRGHPHQRRRHAQRRRRGAALRRRRLRAGVQRQGGQPDERDGRLEAAGELYVQALDVAPPAARRPRRRSGGARRRDAVHDRPLRQRAGVVRVRVPLFERQLARGGPITVTHPEIKRYFMTIREAVELTLQPRPTASGATRSAA
jgi:O-antigen biosynthesis protein WbqV